MWVRERCVGSAIMSLRWVVEARPAGANGSPVQTLAALQPLKQPQDPAYPFHRSTDLHYQVCIIMETPSFLGWMQDSSRDNRHRQIEAYSTWADLRVRVERWGK